ncbi:MAG: hypothetical protein WD066_14310 [Planctomycetaceae bacterium]
MKMRSVVVGSLALFAWASAAEAQYGPGAPTQGGYRPGQIAPQTQQPRYQQPQYQQPQYGPQYGPQQYGPQQPQYQHGPQQPQSSREGYSYRFGARGHLARLAGDLETQANSVCWEMHRNYRLARNWDENYRLMYQILQDAKHIRQLVREQYRGAENQDHIADDLHNMDRLFDRVQRRVARWEPDRVPRNVPVHDVRDLRDPRGGQPVQTVAISELQQRMQRFDGSLNHLMVDYGVKTRLDERADGRWRGGSGGSDAPPPPR